MSEFRTIEIDFDVHKRLELERKGFSESPNEVLRRLLKLNGTASTPTLIPGKAIGAVASRRPWSGKGVLLPHGSEVRMEYNGTVHIGRIEDGEWIVEGQRFNSPSAAAGGVAKTRAGKSTSLDGWIYWHVKRPGDQDWTLILNLRENI